MNISSIISFSIFYKPINFQVSCNMNKFIAFIKAKAEAKAKKNKTLSRRSGILLSLKWRLFN
jgi:hypothetical protein